MLQLICLDLAFLQVGKEEGRIGISEVSQAPDSITQLNCLKRYLRRAGGGGGCILIKGLMGSI